MGSPINTCPVLEDQFNVHGKKTGRRAGMKKLKVPKALQVTAAQWLRHRCSAELGSC